YPFGIAFFLAVLVFGDKKYILVSLVGCIVGYALTLDAFLYIICLLGIVALYYLYSLKAEKMSASVIILCSSGMLLCARIAFMLADNPNAYAVVMSVAEGIIVSCFAYFFYKAIPILIGEKQTVGGVTEVEQICIILSICIVLLSLSYLSVFTISVGRVLGVLITIIIGYYGSAAMGSMVGAVAGLVLSLSGPYQGFYIIGSYAFGGMLAGVFSKMGKVMTAAAFVVSGAIVTLYINAMSGEMMSLIEIFLAGGLFILLPSKYLKKFADIIINAKETGDNTSKLKEIFVDKLTTTASSFFRLSKEIAKNKKLEKEVNITDGLVQASEALCKNCNKNSACFGVFYNDTIDVFNKLCNRYVENGIIEENDFPKYFKNRCQNIPSLLNHLNKSLATKEQEISQISELDMSRSILAEQYNSVGEIIGNIASGLDITVNFDFVSQSRVNKILSKNGDIVNAVCYTDQDGIYTVEITINWKDTIPEVQNLAEAISEICDVSLKIISSNIVDNQQKIKLTEKENYTVITTTASIGKDKKAVCGDTVSSFNTGRGKYVIALSDGMGTGKMASADSTLTVSFLEQLLKDGFPKDAALKLVNSALILKSKDEECATIDIAAINLVNGKTDFLKAGAAPSFVKHKNTVYKLGCSSLPVGIVNKIDFEKNSCDLKGGDILLMVSDGITAVGEKKIAEILTDFKSDDLNTLVTTIIMQTIALSPSPDDLTALAAKIIKSA
ncbi:MAG: SpoIIE family protein phosphatase, partial [Clostridia bacterium]